MFLSAKEIYSPILKSGEKKIPVFLLLIKSVSVSFSRSTQLLLHCFPTKGQAEVSAEAGTSWQGAGPCQSRDLCHPCGAARAPSLPGTTEDGFPLLLFGLHHVLSVASGGAQTNT